MDAVKDSKQIKYLINEIKKRGHFIYLNISIYSNCNLFIQI